MASPLAITLATTWLLLTFSISVSDAIDVRSRKTRRGLLWLHCLTCRGEDYQGYLRQHFASLNFTTWSNPTAPMRPISCFHGRIGPSWFDIDKLPIDITTELAIDEKQLLEAVENVHAMIDKEVAAGTNPSNIFVMGFSQGAALTIASVLLYPKTLGGAVLNSGWIPFNSSIINRISPEAKKTPIFWSHAEQDPVVKFEVALVGRALLKQAGFHCKFYKDSGNDHTLFDDASEKQASWIKRLLGNSSS